MSRKSARKELRQSSRASRADHQPQKPSPPQSPQQQPQPNLHPYPSPPPPHNPTSMSIPPPLSSLSATTTTTTTIAKTVAPRLLLICSLGNPAPYANTLHSAAHHLLSALRLHLSYPPFHPSRPHANGLVSRGQDALLWQSPVQMNASGPAVGAAWRAFLKDAAAAGGGRGGDARARARLVVLHDELELGVGEVRVRGPGGSMKGHKGLKSVEAQLAGRAGVEWWRIGVGIGRPESRERGVVSGYVLRRMMPGEVERIKGAVGVVGRELVRLRDG